jgi:hypothetical protein
VIDDVDRRRRCAAAVLAADRVVAVEVRRGLVVDRLVNTPDDALQIGRRRRGRLVMAAAGQLGQLVEPPRGQPGHRAQR